jgi:hypothetical protein
MQHPTDSSERSGRFAVSALVLLAVALAVAIPGSGESQSERLRLRPPVELCPICKLWLRYEDVVLQAQQEIGPLRRGVFYFYHASDPAVIEPLIRFAIERAELEEKLRTDPQLRRSLGEVCGHQAHVALGIDLEISTSAHGIAAFLTSGDRTVQEELRLEASRAMRSRIPVWF